MAEMKAWMFWLMAALPLLAEEPTRTRESFDANWKFARFGIMADGSLRAEPGAPLKSANASTEEASKGNTAAMAVDGDPTTRWCANTGAPGQWLSIDLGRAVDVAKIEISWENKAIYPFVAEGSSDGRSWRKLDDHKGVAEERSTARGGSALRMVRITVGATPPGQWASIRELRCLDGNGNPIRPQLAADAGKSPKDVAFNDQSWRSLDLPHDWGVEGPFRADLPNETGKLPWAGIGWYRKSFDLAASARGRMVYLDFDGAMQQPTVWVNGVMAGEWKYGYSSFRINLTPHLKFGERNTIAVRLDNPPDSSRWYPGGGIYRHVWMVQTAPVHVAQWGVFVQTPEITDDAATVAISTTIEGGAAQRVSQQVMDGNQIIAEGDASQESNGLWKSHLTVNKPKRWDIDHPFLYTLRTRVTTDGKLVDEYLTNFGIRQIAWDAAQGFLLNGRVVKLNGVCNHHDLGSLGTAVYSRAIERQLEILKAMGCNAIRTSHNPPSPELLDLCDRMGFLVMDEMFDCWHSAKKPNDYHRFFDDWHERDVTALVRRDRNHPSVILWSSGNEIPEQGSPSGHEISKRLTAIFHREDPTRKVTAGCNNLGAAYNGFSDTIDVMGFNYPPRAPQIYQEFKSRRPSQPLVGSETSSCVSSRGIYFFPVDWNKGKGFFQFQVSSYDLYAPGWANRPDLDWVQMDQSPNAAGEFVWTGFDYLGEPTPYNQDETNALNFQDEGERKAAMQKLRELGGKAPSRSSYFGIIDLSGFPKDRYYLYQARWNPSLPMVHILPHWNWPDRRGQVTPVHVYSSGDAVELFLNGKSLGSQLRKPNEYRFVWNDVKYEPGELRAVATKNGAKWAEATTRTTGAPASLRITPDHQELLGDGQDLSFVTVEVVDARGNLVPTATHRIDVKIDGPADLMAIDNGDPTDMTTFSLSHRKVFSGKALVIIRSKRGASGKVALQIAGENLGVKAVNLSVK